MARNKLISFILKDIAELKTLVEGLETSESIPPVFYRLAVEKSENLLAEFKDLEVEKTNTSNTVSESCTVSEKKVDIENSVHNMTDIRSHNETVTKKEEVRNNVVADQLPQHKDIDKTDETKHVSPERQEPVCRTTENNNNNNDSHRHSGEGHIKPHTVVTTSDKFQRTTRDFGQTFKSDRRFVTDLKKAFTLNDRIRYQRELFNGNMSEFTQTIEKLNTMKSLDEALAYIRSNYHWDEESESVENFVSILGNHFD